MRKLNTGDIFAFSRCLVAVGLKEEFQTKVKSLENIKTKKKEFDIEKIGMEFVYDIFEKAVQVKSEKEIYRFLARPFEMTAEEVENLGIDELIEGLKQLGDISTLKAFFKQAVH